MKEYWKEEKEDQTYQSCEASSEPVTRVFKRGRRGYTVPVSVNECLKSQLKGDEVVHGSVVLQIRIGKEVEGGIGGVNGTKKGKHGGVC